MLRLGAALTLFTYYISQIPSPHSVSLSLLLIPLSSPTLLFVNTFQFLLTSAPSRHLFCSSSYFPYVFHQSIPACLSFPPLQPSPISSTRAHPCFSPSLSIPLAQEIRAVCVIGSTGLLSCSSKHRYTFYEGVCACVRVCKPLLDLKPHSLPSGMPLRPVVWLTSRLKEHN